MATRGRPPAFDRDDALDKALGLFWERGYDNTSMADLSTAMELRPPSIYAAFGSKETLFDEVIAHYSKLHGTEIWGNLERFKHPKDATHHVLVASANAFTRDDTPHGCLVVLAAPQANSNHATVNQTLRGHRRKVTETLRNLYAEGQRRGHIPSIANIDTMAAYYATVQHGMSIQARDGATRTDLIAVADAAMTTWPNLISSSQTRR
ncbi:TetR/AcrR family transcriptional regulator [Thalassospira lohafexi]|uniref:TetR family transcriptional regulator n=1 Tax=Thalassospira lohafexi TaxID=744227 RepID=A0A2N3LAN4_9PROT|nr:TetR/AcrR family transcriptional regulator [Thalassospira lohafexi]PKR59901.1 TetR family transcriptional regulator [Thalassospira lohafexi]